LTLQTDRFIVESGDDVSTNPVLWLGNQSVNSTKKIDMERNEGRELVEYAMIAALVAVGVSLMLNGTGQQIADLWNAVAQFVLG
jgi:Flp pilus assembly pilin Flp